VTQEIGDLIDRAPAPDELCRQAVAQQVRARGAGSSIPLCSNRERTILEIEVGNLNGRAGGAYDRNTRGLPTFGLACRM